ncbi:hypothetical protein [Noviherbaspirillum pedocola]|uniref:DUF4402 domain-containing protein n=1 Tax=Noviherbaspirillum pedocola TaxID=2801341 RepID=A0A934W9B4_9BURK|nr:hypothetical protein [Noviherbaspirillum pedocola]MBK4737878.1 hypothetical protein [Noviherbaspirillum pedocola]
MKVKNGLLACVLSFAGVAAVAPHAAMAGPTNAGLNGTINFVGSMDPTGNATCPFQGLNAGTGILTQLGKVAFVAADCIFPSPTGLYASGTLTLTATSGDTVSGTYAGSFIPINNGAAYQMSGVMFSITSGTGRYLNARGTGTLQGTQDASTGKGTITVSGTISY